MGTNEIRIVLGLKAFTCLVRGGELTVKAKGDMPQVKLILSDIGFGPMADALDDAIAKRDHYKPEIVNGDGGIEG